MGGFDGPPDTRHRSTAAECETLRMRRLRWSVLLLTSLTMAASCGQSSDVGPVADAPTTTEGAPATTATNPSVSDDTDSAPADPNSTDDQSEPPVVWWPTPLAELDPSSPPTWSIEVVTTAPHDPEAFTQGLELLDDGRLLESTGIRGQSDVRIVDRSSGLVDDRRPLEPEEFGEGLTVVDETVLQLTWQAGVARRWTLPELDPLPSFTYEGEGWGLCLLDDRLAMSDGSSTLQWRDPSTFELLATVDVTRAGEPIELINELECIDGHVVANIWKSSEVVIISPTGAVVATIDASDLVAIIASNEPERAVLNGIAAHPDGTFSMTGKLWPTRFLVRVVER